MISPLLRIPSRLHLHPPRTPASPPRSHLAGVGRPRHLSPVGRSGSQLPRDSSFYARGGEAGGGKPEETRRGERAWGEKGGAERPPTGGVSQVRTRMLPGRKISLPVSPADPATRGVCSAFIQGPPAHLRLVSALVGRGRWTGLGEAGYSGFSARP